MCKCLYINDGTSNGNIIWDFVQCSLKDYYQKALKGLYMLSMGKAHR